MHSSRRGAEETNFPLANLLKNYFVYYLASKKRVYGILVSKMAEN